jgi:hypothetical protein
MPDQPGGPTEPAPFHLARLPAREFFKLGMEAARETQRGRDLGPREMAAGGPVPGAPSPPTIGYMHTRTRAVGLRHYVILGVLVATIIVAIVATLSAR